MSRKRRGLCPVLRQSSGWAMLTSGMLCDFLGLSPFSCKTDMIISSGTGEGVEGVHGKGAEAAGTL